MQTRVVMVFLEHKFKSPTGARTTMWGNYKAISSLFIPNVSITSSRTLHLRVARITSTCVFVNFQLLACGQLHFQRTL